MFTCQFGLQCCCIHQDKWQGTSLWVIFDRWLGQLEKETLYIIFTASMMPDVLFLKPPCWLNLKWLVGKMKFQKKKRSTNIQKAKSRLQTSHIFLEATFETMDHNFLKLHDINNTGVDCKGWLIALFTGQYKSRYDTWKDTEYGIIAWEGLRVIQLAKKLQVIHAYFSIISYIFITKMITNSLKTDKQHFYTMYFH